jgi:integrase/recombinase XerC
VKTFRRRRGARKPLGTTSNFDELLKQRDREVEVWEEEPQVEPTPEPPAPATSVAADAPLLADLIVLPGDAGPSRTRSLGIELHSNAQLTSEQVLEHFYAGLAPLSRKAYQQDMAALARFCSLTVPALVQELLNLPQAYVNGLAARWLDSMAALSPATRARRLVTLRSFGRAARAAGLVTWTLELRGPKVQPYRDTRGVPEDGVRRMFAAAGEGLEGARNRVILFLLAVLGLRRHEVAGLSIQDFDREGRRLRVFGKGGVEKWLHVPQPVARSIEVWYSAIDSEENLKRKLLLAAYDSSCPLACSLASQNYGERLTGAGVNHIVHQIAERAGVRAWAHALRHSTVTVALDHDHPIQNVRSLSRHAKLETVALYDDNRQQRDASVSDGLAELYDERGTPK